MASSDPDLTGRTVPAQILADVLHAIEVSGVTSSTLLRSNRTLERAREALAAASGPEVEAGSGADDELIERAAAVAYQLWWPGNKWSEAPEPMKQSYRRMVRAVLAAAQPAPSAPDDTASVLAAAQQRAGHALGWLVRLKDGPRDEGYLADKPHAWAEARAAYAALVEAAQRRIGEQR